MFNDSQFQQGWLKEAITTFIYLAHLLSTLGQGNTCTCALGLVGSFVSHLLAIDHCKDITSDELIHCRCHHLSGPTL